MVERFLVHNQFNPSKRAQVTVVTIWTKWAMKTNKPCLLFTFHWFVVVFFTNPYVLGLYDLLRTLNNQVFFMAQVNHFAIRLKGRFWKHVKKRSQVRVGNQLFTLLGSTSSYFHQAGASRGTCRKTIGRDLQQKAGQAWAGLSGSPQLGFPQSVERFACDENHDDGRSVPWLPDCCSGARWG